MYSTYNLIPNSLSTGNGLLGTCLKYLDISVPDTVEMTTYRLHVQEAMAVE